MVGPLAYTLKGYGTFDMAWMRDCFRLFKDRQVNIRKLLLLKSGPSQACSMLEIQFTLPPEAADGFLQALEECTRGVAWQEKSLAPAGGG